MPLTIKAIDAAKPKDKPYKLTDGSGLYLYITTTGVKSWRTNYTEAGKQKTKTFGVYPPLSLADARILNALRKVESSKDYVPTFGAMFEKWLAIKLPKLSNSKHQIQLERTMREHVLPFIGDQPINAIPRSQLVDVVSKLSKTPETASRVAGRIDMVFNYALDAGVIESHGASKLSRILPKKKTRRMPCIPHTETGKLLADIMTYNEDVTRLGLLFIAHTFVRFNEAQNMRWDEVIFEDSVWVIPAERMKMRQRHVVPLSSQVLEILGQLRDTGEGELVFESSLRKQKAQSENTLLFALYRLGYRGRMTVHGFRSLASSVLNEQSGFSGDVIERQLAHSEKDAVRKAYNRAEYLDQRRQLMQWWSDWLTQQYNAQCRLQPNG